jgi:hypothetical protein
MKPNKPVTLAVIIVLKDVAEKAQLDTAVLTVSPK